MDGVKMQALALWNMSDLLSGESEWIKIRQKERLPSTAGPWQASLNTPRSEDSLLICLYFRGVMIGKKWCLILTHLITDMSNIMSVLRLKPEHSISFRKLPWNYIKDSLLNCIEFAQFKVKIILISDTLQTTYQILMDLFTVDDYLYII